MCVCVCRGCATFRPEADRLLGNFAAVYVALRPRARTVCWKRSPALAAGDAKSFCRVSLLSARHGLSRAKELLRRECRSGYYMYIYIYICIREDRLQAVVEKLQNSAPRRPARSQRGSGQISRRHSNFSGNFVAVVSPRGKKELFYWRLIGAE